MIQKVKCTIEDLMTAADDMLLVETNNSVEKSILYDLYGPSLSPAATAEMWQDVLKHTYGPRFDLLETATELSNRSVALVDSKEGALYQLVDRISIIDKEYFSGVNLPLLRETSNALLGVNRREGAYWFGNLLGVLASWLPKLHVMPEAERQKFYIVLRSPVTYNVLYTANIPDLLAEGLDWYREMRALHETVVTGA